MQVERALTKKRARGKRRPTDGQGLTYNKSYACTTYDVHLHEVAGNAATWRPTAGGGLRALKEVTMLNMAPDGGRRATVAVVSEGAQHGSSGRNPASSWFEFRTTQTKQKCRLGTNGQLHATCNAQLGCYDIGLCADAASHCKQTEPAVRASFVYIFMHLSLIHI